MQRKYPYTCIRILLCVKWIDTKHIELFRTCLSSSFTEDNVLYIRRRKREEDDESIAMAWNMVTDDNSIAQYGNDAEELLGRYRSRATAQMFGKNISVKATTANPAACAKSILSCCQMVKRKCI